MRQDLFRPGHAHVGVLLVLAIVVLRFVDEANLAEGWKTIVRIFIHSAALLLPAAFFFSVLKPEATHNNGFIYLAHLGAPMLGVVLFNLGVGLVKSLTNS